jgi:hypothetical protein
MKLSDSGKPCIDRNMMKFNEWMDGKAFVLVGGEVSGQDALYAYSQDRKGRLGEAATTFLDPGTWIKGVEFQGVDEEDKKVYSLEASFDQGKSWWKYMVHDKPILKELA